MAFQHYALFPSLTVLENVAFGLRAAGTPRNEARRVAGEWLDRMHLGEHARAHPAALSGGQAQRVALARALAPGPRLLLLDEPLAALDATTRATVRRELSDHLASFTGPTVMVTHDPVDAAIAQRVVVLDSGRIAQEGTLDEILARPRSRYVADLAGANLVRGTVTGGVLTTADGAKVVIADAPDGAAWALIHPHSLTLSLQSTSTTSARNSWTGVVAGMHRVGDRVRVQIDGQLSLAAEVTASSIADLGLVAGSAVVATVKATDIEVYPA
jgi:molybdate transport system ATP-binding protein